MKITLDRLSGFTKTFQLSPNEITQARNYDPLTGILTFDPDEVIQLTVKWDFVDDFQRNLRQAVFRYVDDPTCFGGRRIAQSETFTIDASIVIFERTGDIRAAGAISICHIDTVLSPRDCPIIYPDSACLLIQ